MKTRILTFCLVVLFLSCENENDVVVPGKGASSEIVSIETARNVAIKLAQKKFDLSKSLTDEDLRNTPHIKNEDVIRGGTTPYFYIFNFDEGFAIISAEKYEHPILAYSDAGQFSYENAPDGIILWIETTKENIDYIRQGKFDTKQLTSVEWKLAAKGAPVKQPASRIAPPEPGCEETSHTTIVGPLLATSWDQGCTYNNLCPTVTSGGACGRAWTGCVATAMTQVMRYWQRPTTYNWATMPNTVGNGEVARLMHDAGLAVGMQYGGNGSGAPHENIPGAFKNTFGYTSATNIDYGLSSYNTVQSNLSYRRPVLLSGYNVKNSSWFGLVVSYQEGHEWVCDGYNETSYTWCNADGSFGGGATYLYFHMNWGWGGTSNGYYGFDSWAPSGTSYNFKYYRRAIVNIYP